MREVDTMLAIMENRLSEQGGPAIRLRLSALKNSNGTKSDIDAAVSALLDIDEVRSMLNLFDGFQTPYRDKKHWSI